MSTNAPTPSWIRLSPLLKTTQTYPKILSIMMASYCPISSYAPSKPSWAAEIRRSPEDAAMAGEPASSSMTEAAVSNRVRCVLMT